MYVYILNISYHFYSQVTFDGLHVYVADFGVSVIKCTTMRSTQTTAGTPGYQSPEQLNGTNIGTHCDIYALGCCIWELFGENPIWEGLTAHAIMFRVALKEEFPPLLDEQLNVNNILSLCFTSLSTRATAVEILVVVCDKLLNQ